MANNGTWENSIIKQQLKDGVYTFQGGYDLNTLQQQINNPLPDKVTFRVYVQIIVNNNFHKTI